MPWTSLLPPVTAVRMVWARTGSFLNDAHSGQSAALVESVHENLDFGNKAKDILKSLPAMSIEGAGCVTVAQYFNLN